MKAEIADEIRQGLPPELELEKREAKVETKDVHDSVREPIHARCITKP